MDRNDPILVRDRRRAEALRAEREKAAQAYFQAHAGEWDRIRALHVAEAHVEAVISEALGPGPFDLFVDLGTGTGRMLELFRERYRRGVGIDLSPAMLAYARAKLESGGAGRAHVRQGDIYDLPLADQTVSAAVMHQVLHFLSDPQRAVREAARVLAPGGRLLIVDFAPHELEFLRVQFAHERLGFSTQQVAQWLADCGLELVETPRARPRSYRHGQPHCIGVAGAPSAKRRDASGRCGRAQAGAHDLDDRHGPESAAADWSATATSMSPSSSSRPRRRRWRRRCGPRSGGSSRCGRASYR